MKRTKTSHSKPVVSAVTVPPTPCIPIIVRPGDLNGIYDYFLKARPSKRLPIDHDGMVLVYDGEGGHA